MEIQHTVAWWQVFHVNLLYRGDLGEHGTGGDLAGWSVKDLVGDQGRHYGG